MANNEYEAYKQRAQFFNATGRTLDGLHGLMFRKDVTVEIPDSYKPYLENVDGKGNSFNQFVSNACYETLKTGWGGVFVDAPVADGVRSKLDAEQKNVYPYMQFFNALDIFNWHYGDFGRQKSLDAISLHEFVEVENGDDFSYTHKDRFRLLRLNENGVYTQKIVTQEGGTVAEYIPTKMGKGFYHIPFYTLPNTEPEKSVLLDLVNVNLSWYRKSADLENGAHWTGVPTPYVLGYEPEIEYDENGNPKAKKPIYLGGSSMLTFPQGVTNIGYLEFAGAGLSQLQNMMAQDETRMAILGARIISSEKKGVEAVDTAKIHRAGENSVLATFANNMSIIFKNILIEYLEWITETEINRDEVTVRINTDYDVGRMNPSELTALVSLWQSGGISKKILFGNLKEGEVIPNEYTFEDMEDEIEEETEHSSTQTFNADEEFDEENKTEEPLSKIKEVE